MEMSSLNTTCAFCGTFLPLHPNIRILFYLPVRWLARRVKPTPIPLKRKQQNLLKNKIFQWSDIPRVPCIRQTTRPQINSIKKPIENPLESCAGRRNRPRTDFRTVFRSVFSY